MSKKSRKRNKKILAALALAGGAAMLAKGRGTGTGAVSTAGQAIGVDRITPKTDYITKKAVVEPAVTKSYLSKMQGGNPDDPTGHIAQSIRAKGAQRAAKNAAMNYQRSQTFDAKAPIPHPYDRDYSNYQNWKGGGIAKRGTGAAYKSGGRVTGIAKRGFGRALMKGKK